MDPLIMLLIVIIIMGVLLGIAITCISIVLYNFLLLFSEVNKRQVCIISDVLGSINLETPQTDMVTNTGNQGTSVEDILNEANGEDTYFNPHEFDVDQFKEENADL